ncbi:phosphotransferase [[Actinomadura] parvosata]|uniref:phosphotransferase n=1 Tax=[Actinomadura] parvosata TaxID=1955412 RepID=UPI00406D147E
MVRDEAAHVQASGRGRIADVEVRRIVQAFGLGGVREVRFLPAGMMNRNWRLRTDAGVFALKEIVDVPVPEARRSLVTVHALAAAGLPVCEPRPTVGGDVVAEVDDAGFFCLLPWVDGEHRRGTDLDVGQARELGLLLGRIHRALADAGLGPVDMRPRAKVGSPEAAAAEADRFLRLISALPCAEPFDAAAAEALERRKELLAVHAGDRPGDEVARGPVGWTHGDFQPLNLLWRDGRVVAVLDGDRLGVRP